MNTTTPIIKYIVKNTNTILPLDNHIFKWSQMLYLVRANLEGWDLKYTLDINKAKTFVKAKDAKEAADRANNAVQPSNQTFGREFSQLNKPIFKVVKVEFQIKEIQQY